MNPTQYQLSLSFEQVLSLVKQLPEADKLKLSEALSKDLLDSKLTHLLQCFKTDEISFSKANSHQMLRIIDESGEDYLYPNSYFMPIELSAPLQ